MLLYYVDYDRTKEFFHRGIVNKMGSFKDSAILPKFRVVVSYIKAFPYIYRTLEFHKFEWVDNAPGHCSNHLTKKFYTSYAAMLMNLVPAAETR